MFRSECQLIFILHDNVGNVLILCLSLPYKKKHLPNCLKRTETHVLLIVFNDVITYTATVSFCRST